jgi:hypothetical protein
MIEMIGETEIGEEPPIAVAVAPISTRCRDTGPLCAAIDDFGAMDRSMTKDRVSRLYRQ